MILSYLIKSSAVSALLCGLLSSAGLLGSSFVWSGSALITDVSPDSLSD